MAATLAAAQKLASAEDTAPVEEEEDNNKDEPPAQAPVAKKPAQPLAPSSRSCLSPRPRVLRRC